MGRKNLFQCHLSTSVILSERSEESKDPYAAYSHSTGTFFDGARDVGLQRVCENQAWYLPVDWMGENSAP